MHILLALYGLTMLRIKLESGSQIISDIMLLITLSPVRAWPESRDITSE